MSRQWIAGLIVLAIAGLAGCANSDYFEPTALRDPANAMVYIYRPGGSNPGKKPLITSYPEILVDGTSHGMLKYAEYLALELAPGKRGIRVVPTSCDFAGSTTCGSGWSTTPTI